MQSGRQLATDITRKLLREAQEKCKTTTTSTTTTTVSLANLNAKEFRPQRLQPQLLLILSQVLFLIKTYSGV
jgi:hypothetical protein